MKLPCEHVYHGECITKWLIINKVNHYVLLKFHRQNCVFTKFIFPFLSPRNAQFATLRCLVRSQRISISLEKKHSIEICSFLYSNFFLTLSFSCFSNSNYTQVVGFTRKNSVTSCHLVHALFTFCHMFCCVFYNVCISVFLCHGYGLL